MFYIFFILVLAGAAAIDNPAVFAQTAVAKIQGTDPNSVLSGEAVFTEKEAGVEVEAVVRGVIPAGKHGFHVHENGSCDEGGKAAGGHFNPDAVTHGFLPHDGHSKAHLGDMGNIEILPTGEGTLKLFLPGTTLKEGKYSILGKAVILHEKEDDFSQPTGNAGGRIGCGIIAAVPEPQK